jgi:DNA modification methylase
MKIRTMTPYWISHDGQHVIYNGDCLDVLPTLPKVDAVITDPPYGIEDAPIQGQERTGKRVGAVNTWHPASDWDKSINPAWCAACCEAAPVVSWMGHWRKRAEVESAMPYPIRAEIVWAKDCHVGPPCPVAMQDERIWLFSASGIVAKCFDTTVWRVPIIPTWAMKEHKNEKPVALMQRTAKLLTDSAQIILDPFMGSGTTGVACVRLGRKFIGVELSRDYCDIAVRRMERELSQLMLFEPEPLNAKQGTIFDSTGIGEER